MCLMFCCYCIYFTDRPEIKQGYPHPVCSDWRVRWKYSGERAAGRPGPTPSGICSGWPRTGLVTTRGAYSPPGLAQRTGEAAREKQRRHIRHEPKPLSLTLSAMVSSEARPMGETVAALSIPGDLARHHYGYEFWLLGNRRNQAGKTHLLNAK